MKKIGNNGYINKFLGIVALCMVNTACTGAGGLSYISNQDVAELKEKYSMYSKKEADNYIPKEFGAFMIPSSGNEDEAPTLFFLKRERSKYYAQTMLFDNSEDKNAIFKRTYLDFGLDGKTKGMLTKLTMKF